MPQKTDKRLGVGGKYLSVWVVLGIGAGMGAGKVFPQNAEGE